MEVTLDVKKFDKSSTVILVGKNETGKTNLLQAIGFLAVPDKEYSFQTLKNAQNDVSNSINFYYTFGFETDEEWRSILEAKVFAPREFFDKLKIKAIEKNVYLTSDATKFKARNRFIIDNQEGFFQKFCYRVTGASSFEIAYEKDASKSEEDREYKKLNLAEFDKILNHVFIELINQQSAIDVSKWKYSKENLITETIDLNEFKKDSEICHPLKNIFNLAGYKTQEEIRQKIDSLSISPKNINKLEKILENAAKEHLDTVWPECRVMFKIKIQDDLKLDVFVVDENDEENTFYLTDRSEGFKQFISLIMGMSAANSTNNLKGRVLIIDEPENHMHPSGIKYMRDELLRIGRNNYVFLATHSEYIIDAKNKERHYIVTKVNNNTSIRNWEQNDDCPDDEILRQAFGLDILSEALKQYNVSLDENTDNYMYNKALKILYPFERPQIQDNIQTDIDDDSITANFTKAKNKVTNAIKRISQKLGIEVQEDDNISLRR